MENNTFYIDKINKTINLEFDFDQAIVNEIKSCDFNVRFNPEYRQWIIPINSYSKSKALQLIANYNFKQVEQVTEKDVVIITNRLK